MEGGREDVWLPSDVECTCSPASRVLCVRVVSPCVCVCLRVRGSVSVFLCVCACTIMCVRVCAHKMCVRVCVCDVIVVVRE